MGTRQGCCGAVRAGDIPHCSTHRFSEKYEADPETSSCLHAIAIARLTGRGVLLRLCYGRAWKIRAGDAGVAQPEVA
jgi:hypothetical protein